jgi:hypothetical protein
MPTSDGGPVTLAAAHVAGAGRAIAVKRRAALAKLERLQRRCVKRARNPQVILDMEIRHVGLGAQAAPSVNGTGVGAKSFTAAKR